VLVIFWLLWDESLLSITSEACRFTCDFCGENATAVCPDYFLSPCVKYISRMALTILPK